MLSVSFDPGVQDWDAYLHRAELELGPETSVKTVLIFLVCIHCYCFKKVKTFFIWWKSTVFPLCQ